MNTFKYQFFYITFPQEKNISLWGGYRSVLGLWPSSGIENLSAGPEVGRGREFPDGVVFVQCVIVFKPLPTKLIKMIMFALDSERNIAVQSNWSIQFSMLLLFGQPSLKGSSWSFIFLFSFLYEFCSVSYIAAHRGGHGCRDCDLYLFIEILILTKCAVTLIRPVSEKLY